MMFEFSKSKDFTPNELCQAEVACVLSSMIETSIKNPREAEEDKIINTDDLKEALLRILDEKIKSLKGLKELAEEVEDGQDKAEWQSAFVPLGDNSDKLLRYETAL